MFTFWLQKFCWFKHALVKSLTIVIVWLVMGLETKAEQFYWIGPLGTSTVGAIVDWNDVNFKDYWADNFLNPVSKVPSDGDEIYFSFPMAPQIIELKIINFPNTSELSTSFFIFETYAGKLTIEFEVPAIPSTPVDLIIGQGPGFDTRVFYVGPDATLTIQGNTNSSIIISENKRAIIEGELQLLGGNAGTGANHALKTVNGGDFDNPGSITSYINFKEGSKCVIGSSSGDRFNGYPFGENNDDLLGLTSYITFERGSLLEFHDGSDPFGDYVDIGAELLYKTQVIKFEKGSWFDYKSNRANVYPPIYGNTFANFRFSSTIDRILTGTFGGNPIKSGNFIMDSIEIVDHVLSFEHTGSINGEINGSIKLPNITNQFLKFNTPSGSFPVPSGITLLKMNGTGPQSITGNSTIYLNRRTKLTVSSGKTIDLKAYIEIDEDLSLVNGLIDINSGARINIYDEYTISGSGRFTLSSGATLGIGSEHGINIFPSNLGNVITKERGFNITASYVYIGSTNQFTGSALPTTNANSFMPALIVDQVNTTTTVTISKPGSYKTIKLLVERGILVTNNAADSITISQFSSENGELKVLTTGGTNFTLGTIIFQRVVNMNIDKDVTFNNLVLFEGSTSNFGNKSDAYIKNQLRLRHLGTTTPPLTNGKIPFYNNGSTLLYELSDSNRVITNEWTPNVSSGRGVPHHVIIDRIIADNIDRNFTFPDITGFRQCSGNFTVRKSGTGPGSFNFLMGTTTTGTNTTDLRVGGNFTISNATFTPRLRPVTFNGSSTQIISKNNGAQDFFNLTIDNPNGIQLNNTNIRLIDTATASIARINLIRGDLDLHGDTLFFAPRSGGSREINLPTAVPGNRNIFSSLGQGVVAINAQTTVTSSTLGALLVFGENVLVALNASTINFGSDGSGQFYSTIDGILRRNGGQVALNTPVYGPASILQYNTGVPVPPGFEWINNTDPTDPGVPMHVQVGLTGVNGTKLEFDDASHVMLCRGDFIIGDGGAGTGYEFIMDDDDASLNVMRSWIIRPNGFFDNGDRPIIMSGPEDAVISTGASGTFHTLTIAKTNVAASVTLENPIDVTNSLVLTGGRVISTTTNLLNVTNSTTTAISGGSTQSFVEGPLQRSTNEELNPANKYAFPVGDNGVYAPVFLREVTQDGSSFRVTSNRATPPGLTGFFADFITGVLANQYWEISRPTGTAEARFVFDYDHLNATFVDFNAGAVSPSPTDNVAVVQRNGSGHWSFPGSLPVFIDETTDAMEPEARFHGNTGLIRSQSINTYPSNQFTLGFAFNKVLDVLPITLLSFNAALQNKDAVLQWVIESDVDVKNFEVEYSTNGERFNRIGIVAKNGTQYNYTHANLPAGVHYYRLKMIAKDGVQTYSKVELLQLGTNQTIVHGLLQNPVMGGKALVKVYSAANQLAEATIVDMGGRIMLKQNVPLMQGTNQANIPITLLRKGMYRLLIRTQDGVEKVLPMAVY